MKKQLSMSGDKGRQLVCVVGFACLIIGVSYRPVSAQNARGNFRPKRVLAAQPVITDVTVVSAVQANRSLNPTELVLGVTVGDASRAYPINMLTGPRREIINDSLGGQPIAATW